MAMEEEGKTLRAAAVEADEKRLELETDSWYPHTALLEYGVRGVESY